MTAFDKAWGVVKADWKNPEGKSCEYCGTKNGVSQYHDMGDIDVNPWSCGDCALDRGFDTTLDSLGDGA